MLNAVQEWYEAAKTIYEGQETPGLLDRALRGKGEVDKIAFTYLTLLLQKEILDELRLIRRAQAEAPRDAKAGRRP